MTSDLQRGARSAGRWPGPGLRGGWDALWSKHDVFGSSLSPCPHFQPQHLPRLLLLTYLLPPWGESVSAIEQRLLLLVRFLDFISYL